MVLSEVDGTGILGLQLRLFDLKTCCSRQPWKINFQRLLVTQSLELPGQPKYFV